jgi:hypothetical protein
MHMTQDEASAQQAGLSNPDFSDPTLPLTNSTSPPPYSTSTFDEFVTACSLSTNKMVDTPSPPAALSNNVLIDIRERERNDLIQARERERYEHALLTQKYDTLKLRHIYICTSIVASILLIIVLTWLLSRAMYSSSSGMSQ